MKRIICAVLAVLLLFTFGGCREKKEPLVTEAGYYEKGNGLFGTLQERFYDYFLTFYGCEYLTTDPDTGLYEESGHSAFVMIQLEHAGKNVQSGVTVGEINELSEKYTGQPVKNFHTDYIKAGANETYIAGEWDPCIGQFMVLKTLVVEEDGTCTGEFTCASIPLGFWETHTEEQIKEDLLNGYFGELYETDTVRLTFREHQDEKDGYYLTVSKFRRGLTE